MDRFWEELAELSLSFVTGIIFCFDLIRDKDMQTYVSHAVKAMSGWVNDYLIVSSVQDSGKGCLSVRPQDTKPGKEQMIS